MYECLVDGEISRYVETTNRGLNYGDGLFETLSVMRGRPRRWQAHMDRLGAGCERLGLPMPPQAILLRDVQTVSAGLAATVVKIVLVRSGNGRGYSPSKVSSCVRIVSAHAYPQGLAHNAEKGVNARICKLRLAIQPALGGMKHLNRLEQVLASSESIGDDHTEGLLLDCENHLVSAISANIFLVMGELLLTPRLDQCGVRGVLREQILKAFGSRCEQRRIMVDMMTEADEVFICNSVRGVVPIVSIDDLEYPVGPVTREIQSWLEKCEAS